MSYFNMKHWNQSFVNTVEEIEKKEVKSNESTSVLIFEPMMIPITFAKLVSGENPQVL